MKMNSPAGLFAVCAIVVVFGGAWEFLFTLGDARITGGVQAIINPIAIK
jgi:hypothetical protein